MYQTLFPTHLIVLVATLMQGIFKQLQAFNDEPTSGTSRIPDLHQADPLNIINVALARQKAAVQAGCSDSTCADSSNLVNTLYQRQQALLQQQQQLPDQPALGSQTEVHADTSIHTLGVADSDGHADAESPNSPRSFEGDTVPDTPVTGTAPLEAALAGDHGLDSRGHQEADEAAADGEGIELVFDQVPIRKDKPTQVNISDWMCVCSLGVLTIHLTYGTQTPTVDGGLVSKFGQIRFEHIQSSCLTSNNYQCIIACCTLVGVFVLHCSALFHDFISADHICKSSPMLSYCSHKQDDKLLSMSPQLFELFPLLWYNICFAWAARFSTWLLITLTPKGVAVSFFRFCPLIQHLF